MKYKRKLIILLIAILIYILLTIIYNKVVLKSDDKKVYILTQNIQKGSEISINNVKELILKDENINDEYITDLSILTEKVANVDLYKGQLLIDELIIEKDKYINVAKNQEIIPIKIKTPEDGVAYKVGKDDLVNIYYTGKTDYASSILEGFEDINVISGGSPGYISVKLFEKIKIIGVYDKYGNELTTSNLDKSTEVNVDTILVSTDSTMAIKIYNLQRYGDFSLSIVN